MCFEIEVCEPIGPDEGSDPAEPRSVAARRLTAALRDFYRERLHSSGR
jgi:hypothetical protein